MLSENVIKSKLSNYGIELGAEDIEELSRSIESAPFTTGRIDQALSWIDQKDSNLLAKLVNLTILMESGAPNENPQRTEIGLSQIEYLVGSHFPGLNPDARIELLKKSAERYMVNAMSDLLGRELPMEKLHYSRPFQLALVSCAMYEAYDLKDTLEQTRLLLGLARSNGLHPSADLADFSLHYPVVRANVLDAQLMVYEARQRGADKRGLVRRAIEMAGAHETNKFDDEFVAARMYKTLGEAYLVLAAQSPVRKPEDAAPDGLITPDELGNAVSYLDTAAALLPGKIPMGQDIARLKKLAEIMVNKRVSDV